jgi:sigma-B regulation protein RsbU (phosphoserine phosphatase)
MRELTYVNAGQVRPLLHRAGTGEVERLSTGGLPVGLLPTAIYDEGKVTLETGDALLCFSDGISEATNSNGDMWDERIVRTFLAEHHGESAGELIRSLVAAADTFTGDAEQFDDMTAMAIKAV